MNIDGLEVIIPIDYLIVIVIILVVPVLLSKICQNTESANVEPKTVSTVYTDRQKERVKLILKECGFTATQAKILMNEHNLSHSTNEELFKMCYNGTFKPFV